VDPLQIHDLLPDGQQHGQLKDRYEQDSEHQWYYGNHPDASSEQMAGFKQMLAQHKSAFAYNMADLPGYTGSQVKIQLVDDEPVFSPRRRYSQLEEQIQEEKCQELKQASFIEPADQRSKYASAATMPAKKDDHGQWVEKRYCLDFRGLNAKTLKNSYSMPLPKELFQRVEGCQFFTSLDLRSGFHQLVLEPNSRQYTAFWWSKMLWRYTRMPYGLRNATAEFQIVMDKVLGDAGLDHCAFAFVDDLLVASPDMESHQRDVQAVLKALHAVGLRVHPVKSVFCADKVEYLGHVITPSGLEPQAAKVAAMASLPIPSSVPQLQSVMGLLNYYRCYLPAFSSTAKPLNQLLQKDIPFQWGEEQQQALDSLKQQLCTEGLALKRADPNRPFVLHTDWSQHGLGAVLAQQDDQGREYMVACASRSLNIHERNYTPWKGELLAVVWGVKYFRPYLHGVHFEIVTDHAPLVWMLSQPQPTGQHARWVLALQEYDFHIRHRPGAQHVNADVLSRHPLPTTVDGTGARLDEDTDPLTAPIPRVVFGPVGTGQPAHLPPEQVPAFPPLNQRRQQGEGSSASQQQQPSQPQQQQQQPAAPPSSSGGSQASRRRRRRQGASQAAPAVLQFSALATTVFLISLQVTAAQGQAAFVQRQLTLSHSDWASEYSCSQVERWELRYSQVPDPLADQQAAPILQQQQQHLQQRATSWVAAAAGHQQGSLVGPSAQPARSPASLNITPVTSTFFSAAAAGLVVYEPFGGLCAGLEMVLRNGLPVFQYLYSDIDPAARQVAQHRLALLQARYPGLLPASALEHTFSALPQDVWQVTTEQLALLSQRWPRQWLVVGGWECQDLSPAGASRGLTGNRSSTLAPLVKILADLQQLQQHLPPAYLVENVAMQHNPAQHIREHFGIISKALGQPVCLDATQFDSLAHRVRNYWTNLCSQQQLESAARQVQRTPGLTVQSVISPAASRFAAPVQQQDSSRAGRYPANFVGQPRSAWPTLMAYKGSRAFKEGQPGAILDSAGNRVDEPTAAEREAAMGYTPGDTQAPGVSEQQRREILGRCIDAHVLEAILAIAAAWYRQDCWRPGKQQQFLAVSDIELPRSKQAGSWVAAALAATTECQQEQQEPHLGQFLVGMAVAAVADAAEAGQPDIWNDQAAMYYLKHQQHMPQASAADRNRVRKRAAGYQLMVGGKLMRLLPDGSRKEVPQPSRRAELIREFHARNGHFGVRRTGALIQTSYWWWGLWADVAAELSQCALCSRVRSSFNSQRPELQPLPISGLMYRWGVDLCGPFPETSRGSKYIMVAVEHYSKHVELIPLPNKEAATTAAAFAAAVLGRYGSPAEVLTDRGGEWEAEFDQLLLDCMVDHRRTSASHPQADGLAERCVGTIKRSLAKLCAEEGSQLEWDKHLPWVMLGYNASPQRATGFSPYQLMHAVTPVVPPAIREQLQEPVDFDDPDAAAADYLARSRLVQQRSVMAGQNLQIAQHRDTLRYAKLRSGAYTPQLRRFRPLDYVYVRRHDKEGLDIQAHPHILRVVEVRPSGVLILQGRCGTKQAVHSSQCAPCHLPNVDPAVDWSLGRPAATAVCERCGQGDQQQQQLIFCDNCNGGWHLSCCQPPLQRVPRGTWVCSPCLSQGVTLEAVQALQRRGDQRAAEQQGPEKFSPAQLRARAMHGRLLRKAFYLPQPTQPGRGRGRSSKPRVQHFLGRVHFRGFSKGGELLVVYEDGDSEITTLQQLNRQKVEWLPEGTEPPNSVQFPTAETAEADISARAAARHTAAQPAAAGGTSTAHTAACVDTKLSVSGTQAPDTPDSIGSRPYAFLVSATADAQQLPPAWELSTPQGVRSALQQLMPGDHSAVDIGLMARSIGSTLRQFRSKSNLQPAPSTADNSPLPAREVQTLLAAVDFSKCSSIGDPFAGAGSIAKGFRVAGFMVWENDINPRCRCPLSVDALQPGTYTQRPTQALVTQPPADVLDLAVPLLAAQAGAVACVHVPGHWLSAAPPARQQWLQGMAEQGRVGVLSGLPRGALEQRAAWLLVFSSSATREQLLRGPTSSSPLR